ncbi:MAG: long-chain fatty acid--CoA ligase [Acidobacteriota bacterium]
MADRTVLDLYRHDVEAPRDDHYCHWTPQGRRGLSTAEFFGQTAALADNLAKLGVGSGDRVMLLSDDRPEWHITDLAVLDLGAVDVPVYPTLTPDQIAYQVIDSGAKVAVFENAEQMDKLLQVQKRCPDLVHLVQIEGDRKDGVLSLEELVTGGDGKTEDRFWDRAAAIDEKRVMTIIYTSGTTGEPKGVMLSHDNLVQNVLFTFQRLQGDRDDLALEFLPLCHVAERMGGYSYMLNATSKAYCSVGHAAELIAKIRPNLFIAVPRVYEKVYQRIHERVEGSSALKQSLFHWAVGVGREAAVQRLEGREVGGLAAVRLALSDRLVLSKIRAGFGGRLRFCITGAAETPGYVSEFFHAIGIPMTEAYGLTETSPCIAIGGLGPGELRLGKVGRVLDNLEVKLAADGELLVKGPSVMSGYWNNPERTAKAFDEDGFFQTGDIAEIDKDGFISIVDRKKDLIVTSGGKNVAPQPIESRLNESMLVDAAVLIGDCRPYVVALFSPNTDELRRCVEAAGAGNLELEELANHPAVVEAYQKVVDRLNGSLARFEQVRRFRVLPVVLSIEGGHLTPTLKVKRRVVETEFSSLIDGMYSE